MTRPVHRGESVLGDAFATYMSSFKRVARNDEKCARAAVSQLYENIEIIIPRKLYSLLLCSDHSNLRSR